MKVFVKGKGEVSLDKNDFKAQGGQGSVYIKGGVAYKIYTDPTHMLPLGKIQELSDLDKSFIIRPLDILLDSKKNNIGYTMTTIPNPLALSRFFPIGFRKRNNITPDDTLKLVRRFQSGIQFIHSKNKLLVDINEFNFMLDESNLRGEVYFIDTDSYETPSFPASAVTLTIADKDTVDLIKLQRGDSGAVTRGFTELSDWFSFAIISFNLFTGIHPYKGNYPGIDKDDIVSRMLQNLSVLNTKVTYPSNVLDFNVIPKNYLNWYIEVLEKGKRIPPPSDVNELIALVPKIVKILGTNNYDINELFNYNGEQINYYHNDYVVTDKAVYNAKQKIADVKGEIKIVVTPMYNYTLALALKGGQVQVFDLNKKEEVKTAPIYAEKIMVLEDRAYIKSGDKFSEIVFMELKDKIIISTKYKLSVMPYATEVFDKCIMQNIVGNIYFTIFPTEETAYELKLVELNDYKILDAKFERGVLIVIGFKNNEYSKFIFRFDDKYKSHDIRVINNIINQDINFTVLENGVTLHMNEDSLEVFLNKINYSDMKVITDNEVKGDVKLYSNAMKPIFTKGDKVFRFNLK